MLSIGQIGMMSWLIVASLAFLTVGTYSDSLGDQLRWPEQTCTLVIQSGLVQEYSCVKTCLYYTDNCTYTCDNQFKPSQCRCNYQVTIEANRVNWPLDWAKDDVNWSEDCDNLRCTNKYHNSITKCWSKEDQTYLSEYRLDLIQSKTYLDVIMAVLLVTVASSLILFCNWPSQSTKMIKRNKQRK